MSGYAEGFGSCFEAECRSSPERRTEHLVLGHGFERRPAWNAGAMNANEMLRSLAGATGLTRRQADEVLMATLTVLSEVVSADETATSLRNSRNPCGTAFR